MLFILLLRLSLLSPLGTLSCWLLWVSDMPPSFVFSALFILLALEGAPGLCFLPNPLIKPLKKSAIFFKDP